MPHNPNAPTSSSFRSALYLVAGSTVAALTICTAFAVLSHLCAVVIALVHALATVSNLAGEE